VKPDAESCARNRDPILAVLRTAFAGVSKVLEIASGTGQHAVYFGAALPHLTWQTSDLAPQHEGIRAWVGEAALPNVFPPVELDVSWPRWPVGNFDGVFTANSLHIISWPHVERLFAGVARHLDAGGWLVVYGPFNYGGDFTSPGNRQFDAWLKARDPASGVRDFEAIDRLAAAIGLTLRADHPMPANNRTLVWQRCA
jgi:hypothetical protein